MLFACYFPVLFGAAEWVDADGTGQESINISNNAGGSGDLSIYLDSSGSPHIAWWDSTPGISEIYYLSWNGSSWVDADGTNQESINISNTGNPSYTPSLYLDSSDNPHISWHDNTPGNDEIYYLYWNGSAWVDADGTAQESINISNNSGNSLFPSLYLDTSDNAHITWFDDSQ